VVQGSRAWSRPILRGRRIPAAVTALLADLVQDATCCARHRLRTGELARRLALLVDRLDAVDFSAGILDLGRRLSGDVPTVNWTLSAGEDVALNGPARATLKVRAPCRALAAVPMVRWIRRGIGEHRGSVWPSSNATLTVSPSTTRTT
jgi:hypothetical protein